MNIRKNALKHPLAEYDAIALVELENRYGRNQLVAAEFDKLLEIYQVCIFESELRGLL
jgi:hypothetical protein